MRISDWSSDVCSSDLNIPADLRLHAAHSAKSRLVHIVDPSQSAKARAARDSPIEEDQLSRILHSAELARRTGNELLCNDIVYRALKNGLRSRRSEEHTSELQSLMRISYAVFCLKKTINRQ